MLLTKDETGREVPVLLFAFFVQSDLDAFIGIVPGIDENDGLQRATIAWGLVSTYNILDWAQVRDYTGKGCKVFCWPSGN